MKYSISPGAGVALDYDAREALKGEAWAAIASDISGVKKAWALLHVIEAHYWRAREALEALPTAKQKKIHGKRYSKGYELDLDVYTRHWLWSNKDVEALKNRGCDFVDLLKESFGYEPERSAFMPTGCSDYRA